MRRSEIFWGLMLVALGGLFFLRTAGYLTGDILSWFWPILLIAAGAWVLLGGFQLRERSVANRAFSIPLQGAREAALTINHGVGRLHLAAGASGNDFVTGSAPVGLSQSSRLIGERLEVSLDAGPSVIPLIGPDGGEWDFNLNPSIPTQLVLHVGATQIDLDLTELQVVQMEYDGGASSLKISLPTRVDRFVSHVRTGASSLVLHVPGGVAARFVVEAPGPPSLDTSRFLALGHGVYQSSDYEAAQRRAEITIEGGATSIRIEQEPA